MLCKHEALEQTTFSTSASATATGSLLSIMSVLHFGIFSEEKLLPGFNISQLRKFIRISKCFTKLNNNIPCSKILSSGLGTFLHVMDTFF